MSEEIKTDMPDNILETLTDSQLLNLVEVITGRKELVGEVNTKVRLGNRARAIKTVELDILITGDALTNIEIENNETSLETIVKRVRYYNSMLTCELGLPPKTEYKSVKPILSIFLTTKDFTEAPEETCYVLPVSKRPYYLDDGVNVVIMNVRDIDLLFKSGNILRALEAIGTKLDKKVYKTILHNATDTAKGNVVHKESMDFFSEENNDYIVKIKNIVEGVTGVNILHETKAEGKAEGKNEGLKEGMKKGIKEGITIGELRGEIRLYKNKLHYTIEDICKEYSNKVSKEEVKKIYEEM